MTTRFAGVGASRVAMALSVVVLASCGGGGGGGDTPPVTTCDGFAGSYTVTTEIVSTTCALGLHVISQPVTWTITQAAPSCNFTMTNSLYPASVYQGHLTMAGNLGRMTFDTVTPAPISGGYALTYTGEDLTLTPTTGGAHVVGSFTWHSAAGCGGTTNVCQGAVPAGCLTPQ